jgi:hypothetical protein
MKRWSILLLTGLSGCTVGGIDFTQPTSARDMAGNYHFTIQAAGECDLPVKQYEFDVVGVLGSTHKDTLVVTLPGGDRRVHMVFCGNCQADPETIYANLDTDGPPTGQAPLPGGRKLLAQGLLTGRVSAQGGRTEVQNGFLSGTVEVSLTEDEETDTLGSCQSDLHTWSLRAR